MRISKSKLDRHQKTKLKIIFYLYLTDSYPQNIQKIVTCWLKSQAKSTILTCISMGALFSGVRPSNTQKIYTFALFNAISRSNDHEISSKCSCFLPQDKAFDQIKCKHSNFVVIFL